MRDAILSGLVTGLAIAMPIGTVAALIVTLTARTSFRVGLGAALGVATVDGTYAAVAVLAGGVVAEVLAPIPQALRILSVVVLLAIAVWLVVSALRPRPEGDTRAGWVTTTLCALATYVATASWQVLVATTGALLGRTLTGPRARVVTGLVSGAAIAVLALCSLV